MVTSRANPLVARLRKLNARRAVRREEGVFVGEGPKLLGEALRWQVPLETVVYATGTQLPHLPPSVRLVEVPDSLLQAVAQTQTPQGVVFIGQTPTTDLPRKLTGDRYLILDGVQDPGNVGTIWRTADAFGADALVLLPGCADPFAPKTVRATMGACFRLPVWSCTLEQLTAALDARGIPLVATALGPGTRDVRQAGLAQAAVVIGSEGRGVSPQVLERCDLTVKIPMRPRCESLNAAVAAGVILWELYR